MRLNGAVVDVMCDTRRMTNRQLARRIDKSSQFVLRLRRGERTASLGTIQSIADVLEVPLEAVLLPHEPVGRAS